MVQHEANQLAIVLNGNGAIRSRRSLVITNRGREIQEATSEIGQAALETVGNIYRSTAGHVTAAGAVRELMRKGAEATREITQEEADAERALYKQFLENMQAAANHTSQAALLAQARATQQLQTRTVADDLEDFGAAVADTVQGRPVYVGVSVQRLLNGGK